MVKYILLSVFLAFFSFEIPSAQSLETLPEAEGHYEVAALNASTFIGHNHIYKHKPAKSFKDSTLTDTSVFRTPLTVFYPVPDGTYPLVIIGHGWGDSKKSNATLARYLASCGYITVLFSARKQQYPEQFIIAFESAYNLLQTAAQKTQSHLYNRIDWHRTAIIGHSMGGTAALHFSKGNSRIHTVVALNPYNGASRFIEMIGGNNAVLGTDLSSMHIPFLIFTGSNDKIAYPEKTFEFYKNGNRSVPSAFLSIKDGMHVSPMDKIGNTITGTFDFKLHTRIRYLILCWLDMFLKNDISTVMQLFTVNGNTETVEDWFQSSNEALYPAYTFCNLPIP